MPLCFATNRVHYSRYGTLYVQSLENLESTHPGAKTEIKENGLSVRRNTLGIRQAIDMTGGQISQFAAKESTVGRWVLNRPFQARFAEGLIESVVSQQHRQTPENVFVRVKFLSRKNGRSHNF